MKSRIICATLLCVFLVTVPAMAATDEYTATYSFDSGRHGVESPEDSAIITARAGLGYYFWQSKYFSDFSMNPAFDHSVQPYLMKRFELRAHLFFLDGGAEYLTSKFQDWFDFESEEQVNEEKDPLARQLSAFAGLRLGDWSLKTDVTFRKFQGSIESNGYKSYTSGTILPLYYYPESGPLIQLAPGEEALWFTTYKQYEIKLVKGGSLSQFSWDLGFQYIEYESPVEMEIQIGHNDLYSIGLPAVPQALMFTKSKIYNVVFGYHQRRFITNSVFFEWYAPLTVGLTTLENRYMELKPQLSFPPTNLVATTYIQASLQYVTSFVKLELGGDFNFMLANIYNESSLDRDLVYQDSSGNPNETMPAGTDITVRSMKWEYFWGIYVRASAFF